MQALPRLEKSGSPEPNFLGTADEPIRRVLGSAEIEKVKKGSGGRSLAFKLWLDGDTQGYFKPEQTFAANWFSELASYYLDRELGLGRVPPAIGRRIEWDRLRVHAARDPKRTEVVVRDGTVRGAVVWWVPDDPTRIKLPSGWESWLRIEPAQRPSPFQQPRDYFRQNRGSARTLIPKAREPKVAERLAELSDLIVFDYLIGNIDRWSADFTNVRTVGPAGVLMYLDNANGFELRKEPSKILEARLTFVQRFRKKTIEALRNLDVKALERRMAKDPLAPLLSEAQFDDLDTRRRRVLEHVASMRKQYGQQATAW
jgi:hypothetical protein